MASVTHLADRRAATFGLAAGLAAFAVIPTAAVNEGPVNCPFRRFTGLPCPGCGMTRSLSQFAHGDVAASLHAHLLGPVLFLAAAATVVVALTTPGGSPAMVVQRAWRSASLRAVTGAIVMVWLMWAAARLTRQL